MSLDPPSCQRAPSHRIDPAKPVFSSAGNSVRSPSETASDILFCVRVWVEWGDTAKGETVNLTGTEALREWGKAIGHLCLPEKAELL